ncbi:MAG: FAD-dependent oxidoreductase [Ahrensia sp.]|nr:FAD-dependent oxidoreductase [Ahrensia sp.]
MAKAIMVITPTTCQRASILVGSLAALIAHLRSMKNVTFLEQTEVSSIGKNQITFATGEIITAGKTIITAGVESFGLLEPLTGKVLGKGVKGQAVLLRPLEPADISSPIIYDASTYVVVHDNGLVAVGSTSENDYNSPSSTDEKLDAVIAHAQTICPTLKNADIVENGCGAPPCDSARSNHRRTT